MGYQEDRQIAKLLLAKGIIWSDLTEAKKSLARRVYALCAKKLDNLENLDSQIKRNKYTKSSLANELQVNRRTLATHNPEISVLVDLLIEKGKRYWSVVSSDKKEVHVLEERIRLLLARDCELVKKEHEVRGLQKELELRKKQYEDKKKEYDDLMEQYQKALRRPFPPFSDTDGQIKS